MELNGEGIQELRGHEIQELEERGQGQGRRPVPVVRTREVRAPVELEGGNAKDLETL